MTHSCEVLFRLEPAAVAPEPPTFVVDATEEDVYNDFQDGTYGSISGSGAHSMQEPQLGGHGVTQEEQDNVRKELRNAAMLCDIPGLQAAIARAIEFEMSFEVSLGRKRLAKML